MKEGTTVLTPQKNHRFFQDLKKLVPTFIRAYPPITIKRKIGGKLNLNHGKISVMLSQVIQLFVTIGKSITNLLQIAMLEVLLGIEQHSFDKG